MLFRQVQLPSGIKGELYLHSMPGRCEAVAEAFEQIRTLAIDQIISLASLDEIRVKSLPYADAIRKGSLPCKLALYPIEDLDTPNDREAFALFVKDMAMQLIDAKRLLMHCGAGIGRTGTVACCILIALGVTEDDSRRIINQAGSHPETEEQIDFIHRFALHTKTH